jgi:hypothetical protein
VGFTAVRQHAVMSTPHEARRHHMEQEALDKGVTEISYEIRGFLFPKNSDNMMYQKALTHFG